MQAELAIKEANVLQNGQNEPQNEPPKVILFGFENLAEREQKIVEIIASDLTITKGDIAKKLNVVSRTIQRDFVKIRRYYRLEWEGPSKGGLWILGMK